MKYIWYDGAQRPPRGIMVYRLIAATPNEDFPHRPFARRDKVVTGIACLILIALAVSLALGT